MEGQTIYENGGTTTRVSGSAPSTSSIPPYLAEFLRRRLQQMSAPAAPATPAIGATPAAPATREPGVSYVPAPPPPPRAASTERHAFVQNNHGMNQLGGYSEAPEGSGNFYGGYRVTDGNPGTHFANMASRANSTISDSAAPAEHPSAQFQREQAAVDAKGGSKGDDWYSLPGFVRDKLLQRAQAGGY